MDVTVSEELVLLDVGWLSWEDAVRGIGRVLELQGIAKMGYTEALLARERAYPTGLPTRPIGVALVHTDSEWVLRSALAIARCRPVVPFRSMANPDEFVEVGIVLGLAVAPQDSHTKILGIIVNEIQDEEWQNGIMFAQSKDDVVGFVKRRLSYTQP